MFSPIMDQDKARPFRIESSSPVGTLEDNQGNGICVGYTTDTGDAVFIPYGLISQHISVNGSTGTGKSVLAASMMAQQMRNGGGLCFIDGKLSNKELMAVWQLACWAGRELDLLIINAGNPSMSNTINPILRGDPQEVSSRIMMLLPEVSGGAEHYRNSALVATQTIIAAFQCIGLPYSFQDLAACLQDFDALKHIESKLQLEHPDAHETVAWFSLMKNYTKDGFFNFEKFGNLLSGLAARLSQFSDGSFGQVMNSYNPEIDFEQCILQNKIIYVMLPTMAKNEQSIALAKILIADIRTAISNFQRLPPHMLPNPPFMILPDEAGSYIDESWGRIFEQSRSSRIFLCPCYQTYANLKPNGEEALSEIVMGNTLFKVFFKQLSTLSAQQAADEIGLYKGTTLALSSGEGNSVSGDEVDTSPIQNQGLNKSSSFTQRDEELYHVKTEEFKYIPIGDCILYYGGTHLYHLRVPMLTLNDHAAKEFGNVQFNHYAMDDVKGLNLRQIIRDSIGL
ncbi:TraM recognition domain-containing protein [Acinetobacter sp. ANC 5380]|uniref:TraM recognition domain-containing protein n=2 Tax=Acinetobacter terrae TaxID=2731247 RepID=A0A7Y2WC97_9GAMM|nr:TraM recognition domain-containing protein [Acinetobacter terrae]